MKQIAFALILMLAPIAPSHAQEPELPQIEGLDEFADSLQRLFEDLADGMAPLMEDLGNQLQNLNSYHAPEILPNGDIIIRRKKPTDPEEPKIGENGDVEL